jgi:cell division protein FtsW
MATVQAPPRSGARTAAPTVAAGTGRPGGPPSGRGRPEQGRALWGRMRRGTSRRVRERTTGLTGTWESPVTSYYLLGGVTALLLLLGLVMVLSSSIISSIASDGHPFTVFLDQAKFALIGVPLLFVASRLPVGFYRRIAWPALGLGMVLQLLVFVPGLAASKNGNTNWVVLPGINQNVQPSEFAKLALALWLGAILAAKRHLLRDVRHVVMPALLVSVVVIALVMKGRDLGTVLILIALVAGALYAAGVPMWMFTAGGAAAALAVVAFTVTSDNRLSRITTFINGAALDPQGLGYQSKHGLWGLGTGGLSGVGLGSSREKWLYLPEAHNDFIFAIIGEELGLLGTLLVLALFGVLAVALVRIARRSPDPFVRITTTAVTAWILGQSLINIGVVIGVFPVIGIPLPLLSAGGSALITTLLALGVMLAFARSEPGAAEVLAARRGVLRRTLAVVPGRRRRG